MLVFLSGDIHEGRDFLKTYLPNLLLYSVMSLPMIDFILNNVIKTANPYYRLVFKTFVFFVLYFLIINYIVKN